MLSERIDAIFYRHYVARFDKKCSSLHEHIRSFLTATDGLDGFIAHADPIAIEKLCDAYFIDVIRYKEYHLCPKNVGDIQPLSDLWVDRLHNEESGLRLKKSKVAALTVKWLLKYKPITLVIEDGSSVVDISPIERRKSSQINEYFALAEALRILGFSSSDLLSDRETQDLLYHFKYRNFDERHFFLIFELLKEKYVDNQKKRCRWWFKLIKGNNETKTNID